MILIDNFNQVIAQIESERGISRDIVISAIEQALVSACKRKFPEDAHLVASINQISGEAQIMQTKTVVSEVQNDALEIIVKEAKKIDPSAKVGDEVTFEVTPSNFGRIAAQTAKQVIIQRIREAEKNVIYDEYIGKVGTIITGTVQRIENKNYLFDLGRIEAVLFEKEQIPGEKFELKEKVRLFVSDIEKTNRGSFVRISRTHPDFLRRLFELEIPEIQDKIIEIMSIARDPGKRAKLAVKSNNPAIGAVGTCVGHMGGRIQAIIKEIGAEKIDVLEWHEEAKIYISNALKPAKIDKVFITSEEERTAVVVVPNDQLSLAIGKSGINVRLSVKLTGWKLDILNTEEFSKKEEEITGQAKLSMAEKIKMESARLKQEELLAAEKKAAEENEEQEIEEKAPEITHKISEVAKELGFKTADLISKAASLNIEIKNVKSIITDDEYNEIKDKLAFESAMNEPTIDVTDIADELNLDMQEFIEKAAEQGYVIKSTAAKLTEVEAIEIKEKLAH